MYIYLCSVISISKIADLDIDLRLNHWLWGSSRRENASIGTSSLPATQQGNRLFEDAPD